MEVVVAAGCSAGVEFWWGFEPGHLVGDFDVPVFFVDEVVVVAAEQDAVAGSSGSAA
ncbi:UNVERIFIED_ORG: hypothetical protein J2X79_001194 [Arthrobacter globiformis]|nr:hypothetical protein [Arthrobacter globiformis]